MAALTVIQRGYIPGEGWQDVSAKTHFLPGKTGKTEPEPGPGRWSVGAQDELERFRLDADALAELAAPEFDDLDA